MKWFSKVLFILALGFALTYWMRYGLDKGIFYGDALGYYSYLPSTFIHDSPYDLSAMAGDTSIQPAIREGLRNFYKDYQLNAKGQPIIQYTYGISLMNLPFFGAVRLYDSLLNHHANGFEARYQMAIKLAGIFFLILGLWFVFKILTDLLNRDYARIGISVLVLGTNLFWFSFSQAGMAHVHLFCLYAMLIYFSHRYYAFGQQKKSTELGMFLVLSLIILIRPTDIIAVIIPLLYGVNSKEELNARISLVQQNLLRFALVFFAIGLMVFMPQVLYWYKMTGNLLYYSYGEQGFNWLSPRIFDGLFGAKNGWFTYTPLMFLAVIASLFRSLKNPYWILTLMILPMYIYITYAWWCYNYINGFGSRPMIHLYALLIIPLMLLLKKSNKFGKVGLGVFMTIACFVNLSFTSKMENGALFSDESNHKYNCNILFKRHIDANDLNVLDLELDQPNEDELKVMKTVEKVSLDTLEAGFYQNKADEEYPPFKIETVVTNAFIEATFVKFSGEFLAKDHVFMIYEQHQLVMSVQRAGVQIDWRSIKINNKMGKKRSSEKVEIRTTNINLWDEVSFYYPMSKLQMGDKITFFVWNAGKKELSIKNIELALVN